MVSAILYYSRYDVRNDGHTVTYGRTVRGAGKVKLGLMVGY